MITVRALFMFEWSLGRKEIEWTRQAETKLGKLGRLEDLTAGEAYKATFWPTPCLVQKVLRQYYENGSQISEKKEKVDSDVDPIFFLFFCFPDTL